jgi:glycosyltransferase involved in cell wall biosynthesis
VTAAMTHRVVHIVHWSNGGVAKLVQAMAASTPGNNAHVVLLVDNGGEIRTDISCQLLTGRSAIGKVLALRKKIREFKPDVVHVHSFSPLLLAALTVARTVPIVRTVHNVYPYFLAADPASRIKRMLERTLHWLTRSHLVSISESVTAAMPWPTRAITLIENGIDFEAIARRAEAPLPQTRPPGQFIVATVGRLEEQKNCELLIRAFAALVSSSRAQPLGLWIVGSGSQRSYLEGLCHQLGIAETTTFFGYQDNPYPFVGAANLYVSPSRYEGFNLALVEAIGLGVPSVATVSGGVTDTLQDEQELLLVKDHQPMALATAMSRLVADTALRQRLSDCGKSLVRRRYSLNSMLRAYAEVYATAIHEPPR